MRPENGLLVILYVLLLLIWQAICFSRVDAWLSSPGENTAWMIAAIGISTALQCLAGISLSRTGLQKLRATGLVSSLAVWNAVYLKQLTGISYWEAVLFFVVMSALTAVCVNYWVRRSEDRFQVSILGLLLSTGLVAFMCWVRPDWHGAISKAGYWILLIAGPTLSALAVQNKLILTAAGSMLVLLCSAISIASWSQCLAITAGLMGIFIIHALLIAGGLQLSPER